MTDDERIRFLFEDAWYALEHIKDAYLYEMRGFTKLRDDNLKRFAEIIDSLYQSLQGSAKT